MRLFFALPCPSQVITTLAAWRDGLALEGKPVSAENFHVTLAFLGMQPDKELPRLLKVAASVEASAFLLRLDKLGYWPGGLLHLAPGNIPCPLASLANQLHMKLNAAGFELEQREYLPHLTLARHCATSILSPPPVIDWDVNEFALFRSETQPNGVRYEALASWKLK